MRSLAALFVITLLSIACSATVGGSSKGSELRPNEAITVEYVVVGTVNIRSCPSRSCRVLGYYYAGDPVQAECAVANSGENWCSVPGGYVYAPCLGMEGVCR